VVDQFGDNVAFFVEMLLAKMDVLEKVGEDLNKFALKIWIGRVSRGRRLPECVSDFVEKPLFLALACGDSFAKIARKLVPAFGTTTTRRSLVDGNCSLSQWMRWDLPEPLRPKTAIRR
jgi:hypothetical protein